MDGVNNIKNKFYSWKLLLVKAYPLEVAPSTPKYPPQNWAEIKKMVKFMVYAYVYDLASSPIASIGELGRSGNGLKPHQAIHDFSLKSTTLSDQ